jgi:hypothetical protein
MMDALHRGLIIRTKDAQTHQEEINDTFQYYRHWQWYLVLFFDASSIFDRTWRVHLIHMSEASSIITMSEFFHLRYVFRAQKGIQIVVDQFTEISIDRVEDGIIHYEDRTDVVL